MLDILFRGSIEPGYCRRDYHCTMLIDPDDIVAASYPGVGCIKTEQI